jgi:hypothetical protein
MSLIRAMLSPIGVVGGPLVAGFIAAWARALNGSRLRPLAAAERTVLRGDFGPGELEGVRVAEGCTLPLFPGFVAITLGSEIYVRGRLADLQPGLLAHELVHVRQFRERGWMGMTADYGRLWVEHGYAGHPMEVEARRLG